MCGNKINNRSYKNIDNSNNNIIIVINEILLTSCKIRDNMAVYARVEITLGHQTQPNVFTLDRS